MTRAASRYLLESRVRARVAARSNVRVLDDHEAVGVLVDPAGAVVGVRLRRRGSVGAPEVLEPADLVVDASGRSSRAPEWLVATGLPAPDESVIDASLAYATRLYRRPSGWSDWRVLLVRDRAPHGTRGGVVFPVEGGRWLVTLGGAGDDRPPTDEAGFETFARSLISPVLADALRVAEPARVRARLRTDREPVAARGAAVAVARRPARPGRRHVRAEPRLRPGDVRRGDRGSRPRRLAARGRGVRRRQHRAHPAAPGIGGSVAVADGDEPKTTGCRTSGPSERPSWSASRAAISTRSSGWLRATGRRRRP